MRYRKTVGQWKDIGNDLYANDTPNDDLESGFQNDSWRCSNECVR